MPVSRMRQAFGLAKRGVSKRARRNRGPKYQGEARAHGAESEGGALWVAGADAADEHNRVDVDVRVQQGERYRGQDDALASRLRAAFDLEAAGAASGTPQGNDAEDEQSR